MDDAAAETAIPTPTSAIATGCNSRPTANQAMLAAATRMSAPSTPAENDVRGHCERDQRVEPFPPRGPHERHAYYDTDRRPDVVAGATLIRRSSGGLLDRTLAPVEQQAIEAVLERARADGIQFHAVRTRQSGRRSFVSLHVLVPGAWTIQRGHNLSERLESEIRTVLPHASVLTHLEPVEDPASFDDETLDRESPAAPDRPSQPTGS